MSDPAERRDEGPGAGPGAGAGASDAAERPIAGLVDTHAHLNHPAFDADRDQVLEETLASGIDWLLDVATDRASAERALELARRCDRVHATVGVHPHEARLYSTEELEELMILADDPRVKALGEMGLDYHYRFSEPAIQRTVFAWQVAFARSRGRPVVVHVREAFEDAFAILGGEGGWGRGVLHCFTGGWEEARRAVDRGFFVSFSGIVTFRRSEELREVARRLPVDRLLIETDSPYLSPEPVRGRRNVPANIRHTASVVAAVRGLATEELIEITARNARQLFLEEDPSR